jgi:oligoendopeptidase F
MPTPQDLNEVLDLKWDLSDLYPCPDDPSFFQDLEKSRKRANEFQAAYKDLPISRLDPPDFLRALKEFESIQEEGVKPFLYASLLFAEDTQNNQYKSLVQRAKERWNELENQLLFFRLALIELPEECLQSFLTHEPLKSYEHALQFLRRFREFTRGEKEEEIISRKNMTGRSAFTTLFDELTGSFTFRLSVDGEEKELTGSEVLALLYSPDRDLRVRAFRTFLSTPDRPTLVIVDSHIAYGAPHKQDTSAAHGEPLGAKEVRLTRQNLILRVTIY